MPWWSGWLTAQESTGLAPDVDAKFDSLAVEARPRTSLIGSHGAGWPYTREEAWPRKREGGVIGALDQHFQPCRPGPSGTHEANGILRKQQQGRGSIARLQFQRAKFPQDRPLRRHKLSLLRFAFTYFHPGND
jgi:hypothetical protein